MTLTIAEIEEILKSNPNKKNIAEASRKYAELNMHVNAVGVSEHLATLKKYETSLQTEVGKNIIESNKGLFNSLLQPTSKVFSAKGGTKRLELTERLSDDFKNILSDVAHGLPLRKWLEKKIFSKYITDPNGFIFIEVQDNQAKPTFKSITSVFDYKINGQKLEYVVFKPQKIEGSDADYYRIVDDSFDYLIEFKNEKAIIKEDLTFVNHFGFCPGTLVSDIFDDVSEIKTSFVSPIIEKANKFLYDNSVHTKHKLLFGFAKYWEYGTGCKVCDGDGKVRDKEGELVECGSCNGLGFKTSSDVTDKRIAPFPDSKEVPIIKEYSGYDIPSLEIWKQYKEDLADHKEDIYQTLWNTNFLSKQKSKAKTATETVLDVQPINDKLHAISDNFERLEKFVIDTLGFFYYDSLYKGCSVNYGRRYLIESPDVLWQKLVKAKADQMPFVFLNNLQKEYIQSLYANNDAECEIQMKLLSIEPFMFSTISEVLALPISEDLKKSKIYFQEWYQGKNSTQLLVLSREDLLTDLNNYIKQKDYGTQQIQGNQGEESN